MSAINDSGHRQRTVRATRASILWMLAAAGLFVASAALQIIASFDKWIEFGGSRGPDPVWVEDHRFDYFFPGDPWESIGTTAQMFGTGLLIQAAGLMALAVGVMLLPRPESGRLASRPANITEIVLALLVAATYVTLGAHAYVSGATGAPSSLQGSPVIVWVLMLVGFGGLVALAVRWRTRSRAAMAASLFLLGTTFVGYLVCTYMIAPVVAGGASHDTARWTETVVGATTAAAAIAVIVAVALAARPVKVGN